MGGKLHAGQYCQNLNLHLKIHQPAFDCKECHHSENSCCPKFDPNNDEDMGYVWDIWYNATFSRSTIKRFTEDVRSLLDDPLPTNSIIPKSSYLEELKAIWIEWLSRLKSASVGHVLAER